MTTSTYCESDKAWLPDGIVYYMTGIIGTGSVRILRDWFHDLMLAPKQVLIDCTTVEAVDPVGAVLLWQLGLELDSRTGTKLSLIHLPYNLLTRLRNHPLWNLSSADHRYTGVTCPTGKRDATLLPYTRGEGTGAKDPDPRFTDSLPPVAPAREGESTRRSAHGTDQTLRGG